MSTVLLVDDEPTICWALEQALTDAGHHVLTAASAEEALSITENVGSDHKQVPDVVVMDVRLPGMDGLSAMEQLQNRLTKTPVIIMTAFGNLETANRAIRNGAYEYITKPFDLQQAVEVIRRALQKSASETPSIENSQGKEEELLIGVSQPMQQIFRKIALVAQSDVPVLITGESGTGKELVATAIHRYSQRAQGPFVPVCVPAMSESLVESELFGHVRGAFTGAEEARTGLLNIAHRGSAFFDEIGDIALTTQVKLLRVLENKEVTPVGSSVTQSSDFRLIAATNRNLEQLVAEEKFREDLFYRLNVFRVELPPLRERREDIPVLAAHFLRLLDLPQEKNLTSAAIDELCTRPWFGNVRELKNTIEHATVVNRSGEIEPEDFPTALDRPYAGQGHTASGSLEKSVKAWVDQKLIEQESTENRGTLYDDFLEASESILFQQTLAATNGNRQEAARRLGIHRQTLREKLKRYEKGLD